MPGSIVVISQPHGQSCAVVGGIMAVRMKTKGVKGVVVSGRVRDLGTIAEVVRGEPAPNASAEAQVWGNEPEQLLSGRSNPGMPIWCKGTSTIGAGGETKPWAINAPIRVGPVEVYPGDIIMMDPNEQGAVCIPANLVRKVLEILPAMVSADEKVIADVENGALVSEAFRKHRGK